MTEVRAGEGGSSWSCPLPLRNYERIVLGHGGGGKLSAELVEHLFLPAFSNEILARLGDAAVLPRPEGRLAFSTDSFVVRPLFFPGGSIGELAIHGTVNDLAMRGARPLGMSAAFILEEGLSLATLTEIVGRMAAAARRAGVRLVTGDTKVVEKGHGDGCYITTTGIGVIAEGVEVGPERVRPGDRVILSGAVGNHGMAVLSVREGLEFESVIESDTAPLTGLVEQMFETTKEVHFLRDPTRGGLAASLNELAGQTGFGVEVDEAVIPVDEAVRSACELLGLDPLFVANEGKLVAVVAEDAADAVLARLRADPLGRQAAVIGQVTEKHPGMVVVRTNLGGSRVLPLPLGEQLPRIC